MTGSSGPTGQGASGPSGPAGGGTLPGQSNCRLTLTSGIPVTVADVQNATTLYCDPYLGNQIWNYNGSQWTVTAFSELSIKATDSSQTGTWTTGTAHTITGLAHTQQLVEGMTFSSPASLSGLHIISINTNGTADTPSGSGKITLSGAPSAGGTGAALTFTLPAAAAFDVFLTTINNGNPTLQWGPAWTTPGGSTAGRSAAVGLLNGIYVNSANINPSDSNGITQYQGTLLGTVYVSVAGQLNDWAGQAETNVGGQRFVSNVYNQFKKMIAVYDASVVSYVYSTQTWRQSNGNTGNKVEYICSVQGHSVMAACRGFATLASGNNFGNSIGIDQTTAPDTILNGQGGIATNAANASWSLFIGNPGIGYHSVNFLEYGGGATTTWYTNPGSVGLVAEVFT